jgi:glucosylceramidase
LISGKINEVYNEVAKGMDQRFVTNIEKPMKTKISCITAGLCLLISGGLLSGASGQQATGQEPLNEKVQVWWSSELLPGSAVWFTDPPEPESIIYKLSRQQDLGWEVCKKDNSLIFRIDSAQTYQSVLGIGTSLEATSIYALLKNKTEQQVRELIRLIVDPEKGMGFNLFRITIGTSDFSDGRSYSSHPRGFYTYQDQEGKPFSIQPDIDLGIVRVLQLFIEEASKLKLAPELKFFASEWSPPAWMKTSGNLIGGSLKPGYEKQLAAYFRQFIEAYEGVGIPVYALTIQNEPNFTPDSYPGMRLRMEQERDIAIAVYEEFNSNTPGKRKIDTRIWINDHNMNYWTNADRILNDLQAAGKKNYIDGVAFHHYNPLASPGKMSLLHQKHPDTDIHLTEHSEWGVSGMHTIQEYFLNWSRSYVYWVPMTTIRLDEHNQGPYNDINSFSPTLIIEKGVDKPGWYVTPEFYLLSQFSKFIRPGAVRIACNPGSEKKLTSVVFKNTDNQMVQVLVNQTDKIQPFKTVIGQKCFEGALAPKTVGTYRWNNIIHN